MISYQLDQIDIGILNLLQNDGELTYKELAAKLRRSKTNIVERIKKLKLCGYIEKNVVLIDIQKIKSVFIAFPHIRLNNHSQESLNKFQNYMNSCTEVMECYHITGDFDFMLKIALSDMVSYNDFLRDKVRSYPSVGEVQSFLVLSQIKRETAYIL